MNISRVNLSAIIRRFLHFVEAVIELREGSVKNKLIHFIDQRIAALFYLDFKRIIRMHDEEGEWERFTQEVLYSFKKASENIDDIFFRSNAEEQVSLQFAFSYIDQNLRPPHNKNIKNKMFYFELFFNLIDSSSVEEIIFKFEDYLNNNFDEEFSDSRVGIDLKKIQYVFEKNNIRGALPVRISIENAMTIKELMKDLRVNNLLKYGISFKWLGMSSGS